MPTDGSAEDVQRALVRLVAADVASSVVSIERPSLDDVFLHLTDRPHADHDRKEAA